MCFKFFSKKKKSTEPSFADSITPFPDEKPFLSENSSYELEKATLRNAESSRDYGTSQSNSSKTQPRESGNVNDFLDDYDYDFLLSEFGGKIEGGSREIKNPTEADIKNAIDNLTLYEGDFFTLFADDSVDGYTSIGAMSEYDTDLLTVDIAKKAGMRGNYEIEKSYEKLATAEETFKLVKDFLNGRAPDADDGTWTFDKEFEY